MEEGLDQEAFYGDKSVGEDKGDRGKITTKGIIIHPRKIHKGNKIRVTSCAQLLTVCIVTMT